MSFYFNTAPLTAWVRGALLVASICLAPHALAQVPPPNTLPPQVVTSDPALLDADAEADEDASVTITPDDRSTRIRTYGTGGRPSREVVDPPILPAYSEAPAVDPQTVIPESDPVRGDMVQPPMWTIWSW